MAQSVIWSAAAFEDFEAVTAFIAKDSTHYAASFAREVLEASGALARFQDRGRIVPEFALADIRELFVRNYRLIYRSTPDEVQILGFIHGSRDLLSLWSNRSS
jgi:plasmid stabilization system protein ParE